jgi:uncharacterized protein YndB with AHSA1/START domain
LPEASDHFLSASIVIDRSPEDVYDLVADITRMGEWSPVCVATWWDENASATVGGRFTGRNETEGRSWETRCEVVAADRGQEFAFLAGDGWVRWTYVFAAHGAGTEVTESWQLLPSGQQLFAGKYGDDAATVIANRRATAAVGIPATLAAIKVSAESR